MINVVFDTDPGVDDALALLYLHRHPEIRLAGITTAAGNGTIETVTRNARYLAEHFGMNAPLARGAATPLSGRFRVPPAHIHGENALGDVPIAREPEYPLDLRPAHELLIDLVRGRPGEITIVAVAMLTNLALALQAAPEIAGLVRNVVIMGGAFGGYKNYGNASPAAEANMYGDPDAADIVCTAKWPVTMIPLDVTERTVMTTDYLARLRDAGTPEGAFIWDVTRKYEAFHDERDRLGGIYVHDPCAAVCALDPSPFTFREGPVRVVTDGIAAGMTIQMPVGGRHFPPNPWDGKPVVHVATGVNSQRVLELFAEPFRESHATPSA